MQNLESILLFTKFAAQKGKARMETIESFVIFVHYFQFLDERIGPIAGM